MVKKAKRMGRPTNAALGRGQPRSATISARVTEDVQAYIRDRGTRVVEDSIRATQDFRNWQREQKSK